MQVCISLFAKSFAIRCISDLKVTDMVRNGFLPPRLPSALHMQYCDTRVLTHVHMYMNADVVMHTHVCTK